MRLKLICCEVFTREICSVIARSPNEVDVEFLPKGLHDLGCEGMSSRLAAVMEKVEEDLYDAILFGYGLCNNGLMGLQARAKPLVVPRAHDCITLFLGSKERYLDYFERNPGTYFLTSGWIERGAARGEISQLSIQERSGMNMTFEELVEKYGEDNAEYLYETLVKPSSHYGKYAFIEMGVEPDSRFEETTKERATNRGWQFEKLQGRMVLIEKLLNGPWDNESFLVVPPGHRIVPSHGSGVIEARPVE